MREILKFKTVAFLMKVLKGKDSSINTLDCRTGLELHAKRQFLLLAEEVQTDFSSAINRIWIKCRWSIRLSDQNINRQKLRNVIVYLTLWANPISLVRDVKKPKEYLSMQHPQKWVQNWNQDDKKWWILCENFLQSEIYLKREKKKHSLIFDTWKTGSNNPKKVQK